MPVKQKIKKYLTEQPPAVNRQLQSRYGIG